MTKVILQLFSNFLPGPGLFGIAKIKLTKAFQAEKHIGSLNIEKTYTCVQQFYLLGLLKKVALSHLGQCIVVLPFELFVPQHLFVLNH